MLTLSAPARKYAPATSSAGRGVPSGSTVSRMPPPMVSGDDETVAAAARTTASIGWSRSASAGMM